MEVHPCGSGLGWCDRQRCTAWSSHSRELIQLAIEGQHHSSHYDRACNNKG